MVARILPFSDPIMEQVRPHEIRYKIRRLLLPRNAEKGFLMIVILRRSS